MRLFLCVFCFIFIPLISQCQNCNDVQNLTENQENQLSVVLNHLQIELENENLVRIDSLNLLMKNLLETQAGLPENIEEYRLISNENTWIDKTQALLISRELISNDSLTYVNLWKTALGQKPPNYQEHSLFLRTSAEFASGLLKIANNETDLIRKNLYQSWAKQTFDSLLTKQLANGAFPFPDLRTYNDPIFTSIIQNYISSLGADSINVLQNGWIIDDNETGEFKFDAGIIANSFYEAYYFLNDENYKDAVISIGNYLKNLKFNTNYNYNSFSVLGLTRAFQLSNDSSYLERAIKNLRFSVSPGQLSNGRWLDGHNASSRYHSIIIQNSSAILSLIPDNHPYKNTIDSMYFLANKNIVNQTLTCGSSTGFNWLMKNYLHFNHLFTESFNDSISILIGKQINQAANFGDYLNVALIGDYLELLNSIVSSNEINPHKHFFKLLPNPFDNEILIINETNKLINFQVFDLVGTKILDHKSDNNPIIIDLLNFNSGSYIFVLSCENEVSVKKIIKK